MEIRSDEARSVLAGTDGFDDEGFELPGVLARGLNIRDRARVRREVVSECVKKGKVFEGFRAEPYLCPAGHVTIGYGLNLEAHPGHLFPLSLANEVRVKGLRGAALLRMLESQPEHLRMRWSEPRAAAHLESQIEQVAMDVEASLPWSVGLRPARFGVLVDMGFNMGVRGLMQFKKTLGLVERGRYGEASEEMLRSRWAGQVKGRAVQLSRQMRSGRWE